MSYVYENEDILQSTAATQVFPKYCMSFSESALYIAESAEESFNEMMYSIGINELAVFESTGAQIVYEGKALADIKDNVIGFFQKIWGSIKGWFENLTKQFKEKIDESKKNIVGKIDLADIDFGEGDKRTFGKIHEFNYGLSDANIFSYNADIYAHKVITEFSKLYNAEKPEIDAKKEELEKEITSEVSGMKDAGTVKEMGNKIRAAFIGEVHDVDKAYLNAHFKEISDTVLGGKVYKQIKSSYKDSRKFIDDMIKEAKTINDTSIVVIKEQVKVLKDICNCMVSANGVFYDIVKKEYMESRNVIIKVAIAAGKGGVKKGEKAAAKSVGESVAYTNQLNLLESVLDF